MQTLNDFHTYVHAVGTGRKSNRDLSFDEAKDAMKQMLEADIYAEQSAAFLLGWRMKPESIEEFRGALSACDEYVIKTKIDNSIELGYPYDGKVNNTYIFVHVAKFLKAFNVHLVLHGGELQPAKGGINLTDICEQSTLDTNVHFFHRRDFFNKMYKFSQTRARLGLRSAINTIEKLPNISESNVAFIGVFHKPYVQKYIDIFASRYKKLVILKANEGTPEIFSKTRYWVCENGEVREDVIDPKTFGIEYKKSVHPISLEESLNEVINPSPELLQLAKLNAAFMLYMYNKFDSTQEAYDALNG